MRGKGKGERGKFGLYVHTPFCKSKCIYCDFNSYAGQESLIGSYIKALISEIDSSDSVDLVESVYFGGGNPALLGDDGLAMVMDALNNKFSISHNAEITIESNPENAVPDALLSWRRIGFNRLSIGFQSFDDRHLRLLGRRHDSGAAIAAFNNARDAGFENINIDMIFGLPGQAMADWIAELDAAARLSPEHISAYGLTIEPGTALEQLVNDGKITLPGNDEQAEMMEITHAYLTGVNTTPAFEHRQFTISATVNTKPALDHSPSPVPRPPSPFFHYEISNFAATGRECRHNLNYWRGGDYLGFGAGAHSHRSGRRWWNTALPADYIEKVLGGSAATAGEENLTKRQRLSEAVFLGLRLAEGLQVRDISDRFDCDLEAIYAGEIGELERLKLLTTGDRWRLTSDGILLANEVMSRFV